MKKIIYFMCLTFISCGNIDLTNFNDNSNNFKYKISYAIGIKSDVEYSLSEIEYLNNGCIKFTSFNNGDYKEMIICGTFKIEKYN